VNILRDLPEDLRQGRCYIPRDLLAAHALTPSDLLDPAQMSRFDALYKTLLRQAADYLSAGWDYTNAIPRAHARVRLACAWPILIGIRTIDRLRSCNVLEEGNRIKITRFEIYRLILRTILAYPFRSAWSRLLRK
jgi:farnesyl-diphosphate farnesyltransferase